jgi:hypothetical protein
LGNFPGVLANSKGFSAMAVVIVKNKTADTKAGKRIPH